MGLRLALAELASWWDDLPAWVNPDWEVLRPQLEELMGRIMASDDADELARLTRRLVLLLRPYSYAAERLQAAMVGRVYRSAIPTGPRAQEEPSWSEAVRQVSDVLGASTPTRHVNVVVATPGRQPLPLSETLPPGNQFDLRIDIGPRSPDSAVENATSSPFPDTRLPAHKGGNWLEVVVTSGDFVVERGPHAMYLPTVGPSWVCSCRRGGPHHCTPADRQPQLAIPIITPSRDGPAVLHIAVYASGNLLQSQLLRAEIGTHSGGAGYRSRIEYTLGGRLAALSALPARQLNLLANRASDGARQLVVNGETEFAVVSFAEAQVDAYLTTARKVLRDIHIDQVGHSIRNRYSEDNSKSPAEAVRDLTLLARLGWDLYAALLGSDLALARRLREALASGPATIQVASVNHSATFPWALVYDIPLDSAELRPCLVLSDWTATGRFAARGERHCPHAAAHAANTLCPYGFWGFTHVIEQPPSMPSGRQLPVTILGTNGGDVVVGLSLDMDTRVTDAHVRALRAVLGNSALHACPSRAEIRDALRDDDIEIVYFYCHGFTDPVQAAIKPALGVGKGERIITDDLLAWALDGWSPEHWATTAPLVVINGCHTAELGPRTLANFVDAFVGLQAAGVIGTEIPVHQRVAGEAALELISALGDGLPVGEAMHLMRHHLLAKGNVLGLAYTAYCSASLRVVRRARVGE